VLTVENFDGDLFRAIDEYKAKLLDAAHELEGRVASSTALGDLITRDVLAQGRRTIESIDVRNQTPVFPQPIYLTYLQHPEWIGRTDDVLVRLRERLRATPRQYREAVTHARTEAVGGLFELNVFDVLDRAFPRATPYPRIPGTPRRSDVEIVIEGRTIYVEATAMTEGTFWDGVTKFMQEAGLSVHSTAGPGPSDEARRIIRKIAHELIQTAPDAPNVICISFFGTFPSSFGIDFAFEDLFQGAPDCGRDQDVSDLSRVDCILEFGRSQFQRIHVNPNVGPSSRLTTTSRDALAEAFEAAGDLMIR
jgi:hypothetical protein